MRCGRSGRPAVVSHSAHQPGDLAHDVEEKSGQQVGGNTSKRSFGGD